MGYPKLSKVSLPRIGAMKTILDVIAESDTNTEQGDSNDVDKEGNFSGSIKKKKMLTTCSYFFYFQFC